MERHIAGDLHLFAGFQDHLGRGRMKQQAAHGEAGLFGADPIQPSGTGIAQGKAQGGAPRHRGLAGSMSTVYWPAQKWKKVDARVPRLSTLPLTALVGLVPVVGPGAATPCPLLVGLASCHHQSASIFFRSSERHNSASSLVAPHHDGLGLARRKIPMLNRTVRGSGSDGFAIGAEGRGVDRASAADGGEQGGPAWGP